VKSWVVGLPCGDERGEMLFADTLYYATLQHLSGKLKLVVEGVENAKVPSKCFPNTWQLFCF